MGPHPRGRRWYRKCEYASSTRTPVYCSCQLLTPNTHLTGSAIAAAVSKSSDLSSDDLQDYDALAELQETHAMIDDMAANDSDYEEQCKDTDGWIALQNA